MAGSKGMEEQMSSITPTPQGPEGPFYLPNQPVRKDIREDRIGLPFLIKFRVRDSSEGQLIQDAELHCWHADAEGFYSSYSGLYPLEEHSDKFDGEGHVEPTDDSSFLRGIQRTDAEGEAEFQTIFPGWYGERTPHIHFKVFVNEKNCFTGEVYFEDSLTDELIAKGVQPYSDRDSSNKTTNDSDPLFGIYTGIKTVVKPEGDLTSSIRGTLEIFVVPDTS